MEGGIRFTRFAGTTVPATLPVTYASERRLYRAIDPAPGTALFERFAAPPPPFPAAEGLLGSYRGDLLSDSGPIPAPAPILMIVAFDVPPERADLVERWYAEEHIALLCRAPGWLRARRYAVRDQSGAPRYTSLALHELADLAVMDSAERAYARSTAWRAAMQDEPWFRAAGRFVFELLESSP